MAERQYQYRGDRISYIFPLDEKSYHYGLDAKNGSEFDAEQED